MSGWGLGYQLALLEEVGDGNVEHRVILPDDIEMDNEVAIWDRPHLRVQIAPWRREEEEEGRRVSSSKI